MSFNILINSFLNFSFQRITDVRSILRLQGPNLTDATIDLIVSMISNSNVVPQGRRWERTVLQFSLSLWNRSPSAYSDATESGTLLLPSVRLLQYYKNSIDQQPGLHSTFIINNFYYHYNLCNLISQETFLLR